MQRRWPSKLPGVVVDDYDVGNVSSHRLHSISKDYASSQSAILALLAKVVALSLSRQLNDSDLMDPSDKESR